ncbi:hypothetical protein ACFFRR_003201 [Megaselia abdita]
MRSNLFNICLLIFLACVKAQAQNSSEATAQPTAQPTTKPTPGPAKNETNFQCAVCRSDSTKQADCKSDDVGTKYNTLCVFQPETNETLEACYILRTSTDVVVRDCYTTAVALDLDISSTACTPESKCFFCKGANCNTLKPPNSAANLQISGILVAVLSLIASKYL